MYDFDEHETFDAKGRLSPFSECLEMLRRHQEGFKIRIDYLEKENDRLTDEHFKEKYVRETKEENERLKKDARRGFPISEEENIEITKWQEEHIKEHHPKAVNNPNYFGAAGGNWTYSFTPTGIGTIFKVKCYCGEEHDFSRW